MFKIESLTFFHEDDFQTYNFSSHAFVYGANTVGKTAMTKAINYVLGSSDPLSYQGLDNIDGIEAHLSNEQTDLWIKRTINGRYAYKRTINREYTDVSAEIYKDNICLITSPEIDHHFMDVYYKVFEEKPSFRSFNFLNFVEEKGLGDLSAVFTMAKELRHQIRIQKIMNFFFNYQNIEKIYEKEVELEAVESSLRSLQLDYQDYTRMLAQQKQLFTDLQLRYTGNIPKDLKTFEDFKNSFVRKKKSESKDIVYLSKASFALSEEIKLYSFMKHQSDKMQGRKERSKRLLSMLMSIVSSNPEYADYVEVIEKNIVEIDNENVILSLTDYQKAIKDVQDEKDQIDEHIARLKGEASELSYEMAIKKVGLLEHIFSVLNKAVNIEAIHDLKSKSQALKKEIKELRSSFDKKAIDTFNEKLTSLYLGNKLDIKHIIEDANETNFSLEFDPFRLCLFAKHQKGEYITQYMPGSMARQTHLQLLVYLNMFAYLQEKFKGLVYAPILIIDSANQPMGVDSFQKVYPVLINLADQVGIQTIFLSKDLIDSVNSDDLIDISAGLNKFHKQTRDK